MAASLGTLLGAGWAAGVNLYATVLLLGLAGRLDLVETPEALQSTAVLGAAGILYVLEFVIDKIPFVDSTWDAVHTVVRPVGAALVGTILAGDGDVSTVVAAGASGGMALGSHAAKAGTRVAVNASPEPATNIVISLFEDGLVAGMVWVALEHPLLAGVLAVLLLGLGLGVLVLAWRLARQGMRRWRTWRARRSTLSGLR